ncbi:hypothetical protein [Parageobacillus sp. G301]|uniref:hypothetical protein n=1 Tax=Parageobacillus sp. G301 TaxID=2998290 RepID=UPI002552FE5B|nr:hypothetical protein [Parageobacillus sp. G301]
MHLRHYRNSHMAAVCYNGIKRFNVITGGKSIFIINIQHQDYYESDYDVDE